jgi:hypothetical protein
MSADAMAPDAVRGQRPVAAIVSSRFLGGCGTFVCVGLAGVAALAGDVRMAGREVPIVFTQVPAEGRGTPAEWRADGVLRGDGFEGARLVGMRAGGVTQELSTGFHSACDPEVSPDGRKLAFAAKRGPGSTWGIWERDLESGEVREVVGGEWDRRGPRYLGSLFTLDSPEPWSTLLFTSVDGTANEPGHGAATSLHSVKLDGTEARRLTFEPSASFDPVQLWDGRVIYAVWRYPLAGFGGPGRVSLFGVNIDGTDQLFYGGEQGRRIQHMPCATGNGHLVFVELDEASWDGAGQLACLREERPLHSYRSLTQDDRVAWSYPAPFDGDEILVSRRPAQAGARSGLYRFDIETGRAELVFESSDCHIIQGRAWLPRAVPDGRSTVVNPKHPTGILYGLNCYVADAGLQPHLTPGSIPRLRVIEGVPSASKDRASPPNGTVVGRRLLGEAVVEKDGSFQFEVPADLPVQLQALDGEGMALATCGWIWVKQKENRGCIGCHEDGELIPENRFVAALARPPNRLTLPAEKRRMVSFKEQVLPVLGARCATADCHGDTASVLPMPSAGTDAEAGALWRLYVVLLEREGERGKYVDPGRARTSPLIWNLFGQELSRPWDSPLTSAQARGWRVNRMPPVQGTPLTAAERRVWVEWVDLGAQWEAVRSEGQRTAFTSDHEAETP